ncbi:DUF2934 domain-containing protein [Pseudomonas fluorescens]
MDEQKIREAAYRLWEKMGSRKDKTWSTGLLCSRTDSRYRIH